jgi:hypothetical protein
MSLPNHPKHATPDEHDLPDEWHQHPPGTRPQNAHAEVANAHLIMGVGVLMFIGLIATIAVVYGYYTWYTTGLLDKQEKVGLEASYIEYRNGAAQRLDEYSWLAEDPPIVPKDTVQGPLDVAARKVATKYATLGR